MVFWIIVAFGVLVLFGPLGLLVLAFVVGLFGLVTWVFK